MFAKAGSLLWKAVAAAVLAASVVAWWDSADKRRECLWIHPLGFKSQIVAWYLEGDASLVVMDDWLLSHGWEPGLRVYTLFPRQRPLIVDWYDANRWAGFAWERRGGDLRLSFPLWLPASLAAAGLALPFVFRRIQASRGIAYPVTPVPSPLPVTAKPEVAGNSEQPSEPRK